MIDSNNPEQVAWLQQVNAELGNLMTSNSALTVRVETLNKHIAGLSAELQTANQANADMAQTNAKLRAELERKNKDAVKKARVEKPDVAAPVSVAPVDDSL